MKSLTTAITEFFEDQEIKFKPTEHADLFKLGFTGDHGVFMGYVEANEEKRTLLFETFIPVGIPKDRRLKITELVTRFNQDRLLGPLELDMDGGTVSSRTSVFLGRSELHPDIKEHLLQANWCAVDRVFPAVVAVLHGYISPKEAAENTQNGTPEPDGCTDDGSDEVLNKRLDDIRRGSPN